MSTKSTDHTEWLARTFARNRALYGGFTMELDPAVPAPAAPAPAVPADPATPADPPSPAQETDWKTEARKWEKQSKANAQAAARLAEIEESQKTAEQKTAEALAKAQADAQSATATALRYEVAAEKGIPLALASRLTGSTRDELLADADALMALIPATDAAPAAPAGPVVPGQTPGGQQVPAQVTQADLDALEAAGKYDEINRLRRDGRLAHLGVGAAKR